MRVWSRTHNLLQKTQRTETTQERGETMLRFNKAMMLDGAKRMNAWLKKGEGYPNWLKMTDMDKKKEYKLTPNQYNGLYENWNMFQIKNGRQPNYVTLDHNASKNCLVMDYQDKNYTCCPTSLSMASQLLFNYKSESQCSKALGTAPVSGTSPQQLIDNAPKLGFKIIPIKRDFPTVKSYLKKGFPVIGHFQTGQTRKCKGDYIGEFGHYVLIWDTTSTEYVIADPSRGVNRKYKYTCFDKANQGYRNNYYAVTLK